MPVATHSTSIEKYAEAFILQEFCAGRLAINDSKVATNYFLCVARSSLQFWLRENHPDAGGAISGFGRAAADWIQGARWASLFFGSSVQLKTQPKIVTELMMKQYITKEKRKQSR